MLWLLKDNAAKLRHRYNLKHNTLINKSVTIAFSITQENSKFYDNSFFVLGEYLIPRNLSYEGPWGLHDNRHIFHSGARPSQSPFSAAISLYYAVPQT